MTILLFFPAQNGALNGLPEYRCTRYVDESWKLSLAERAAQLGYMPMAADAQLTQIMPDIASTGMSAYAGDYVGAGLSLAGTVVPGLSQTKAARMVLKLGARAEKLSLKAAKNGEKLLKPLGLGSTGRTAAKDLVEQLAMKEIMSNPSMGNFVKLKKRDDRLKVAERSGMAKNVME